MYAKKILLGLSCLMAMAGINSSANAETSTGQLQVKVIIGSGGSCSLTTGASGENALLDFGTLTAISDKNYDAQTSAGNGLNVTCDAGVKYKLGLDYGLNRIPGGFYHKMTNGKSFVSYLLTKDATYNNPWGSIEDNYAVDGVGTGAKANFTVYGRINAQVTPENGLYTDTVVATLQF